MPILLLPDYVMNKGSIPRYLSIRFTRKTWEFPADDRVANTGPTPEEIAVSILAEIIAVRRGGKVAARLEQ